MIALGAVAQNSGAAYDPLSLAWRAAYWAEDPSWTPPSDGAAVSSWADATGGGSTATQGTGSLQPVFRTSHAGLNGRPAVDFNEDYMRVTLAAAAITQPHTVFVVTYVTPSGDTTTTALDGAFFGDSFASRVRVGFDAGQWQWLLDDSASPQFADNFSPGPHALAAIFRSASDTLLVDGQTAISASAGNQTSFDDPYIGARSAGGTPLVGAIAFIGFFEGELPEADLNDLLAWSRSHYGTPAPEVATQALLTTFTGSPVELIQEPGLPYTAFPYGNVWYDEARDKICIVYTAGSTHTASDRTVYFRTIDPADDSLSTRVQVVATTPALAHGAGMAANGDYVVPAPQGAGSYKIHVSTDGGATWDTTGYPFSYTDEGTAQLGNNSCFLTSTGALLTYSYGSSPTDPRFVSRSTDNGVTWTASNAIDATLGDGTLESAFMEHGGRIFCYLRSGVSSAPYTTSVVGKYVVSDDDGVTWDLPQVAPIIADQNNNPAAIIEHSDVGLFEIFYGSRKNHPSDSKPSIYQAITSGPMARYGDWRHTTRLVIGEATLTGPDFGYPAAVRVGTSVYLFWYDGVPGNTSIFMWKGTRP